MPKFNWFRKFFARRRQAAPVLPAIQPLEKPSVIAIVCENRSEFEGDLNRDKVLESARKALLEMDPSQSVRQ